MVQILVRYVLLLGGLRGVWEGDEEVTTRPGVGFRGMDLYMRVFGISHVVFFWGRDSADH